MTTETTGQRWKVGYPGRVEWQGGRGWVCDCRGCRGYRPRLRDGSAQALDDFADGFMFSPGAMRGFRSRIRWVDVSQTGDVFVGMTSGAGWDVSDGRVAEVVRLCPYGHAVHVEGVATGEHREGPIDRHRVPVRRLDALRAAGWSLGWDDCHCHGCVLDREAAR